MEKIKITQKEFDELYDLIPDIEKDGKQPENVIEKLDGLEVDDDFEKVTEKYDEDEVIEI